MNANQNKIDDDLDLNLSKMKHSKNKYTDSSVHRQSKNDDSDLSPYRRSKYSKNKHVDLKSSRRRTDYDSDSCSPEQLKNYDSDVNLPKRSRNNDSDLSPPRQSRNNDSDLSPPRQSKNDDSDLSPSRKNAKHRLSTHGGRSYKSSGNRDSDSDFSPPRKRKQNVDADLYESRKKDKGSHLSSARHRAHRSRRDNSPRSNSSRADREHEYSRNSSKQRRSSRDKRERKKDDYNHKPRSYSDTRERRKKSRWDEETDSERRHAESYSRDHDGRMTKTLDGKTAGLQDAKALREETRAHKQREAEQFNKLSKTVSGVGQAPIVRDKTGRKRNLEAEAAEEREREIQQREINEKYAKWGKGLKQMEDREEKMKNDLYEMSKPLARYADDADLDRELREQEREGDPMLKYIKQKQIKEGKRKPDPPQYRGSYAPNRFGVKPGHRWDGVDRSNGFEKKWFEAQNAKRARQEEAHKWSTADM
ncbi:BUD13-like protein [Ooceraea biroi]|uniref:BUD13 homolog n=2 Tax=Ooceraea biroi TaxID=2015173 RepID=A0A026WSP2_OOCBI|nr:BUD13-like protein [Ooceraea biroi]